MTIKLDHINLSTNNLKESTDWYLKIFGMEVLEKGVTAEGHAWAIVGANDTMICMTESVRDTFQPLMEQKKYHQINHFGIRIDNERLWKNKVRDYQLELYYGGINEYPNSRSWYVKDPSGHTIEVSYSSGKPLKFN